MQSAVTYTVVNTTCWLVDLAQAVTGVVIACPGDTEVTVHWSSDSDPILLRMTLVAAGLKVVHHSLS